MKPLSNGSMNGVISRSVYIPAEKTSARSRLMQSKSDYGKSTPKSRLSASMENYMGNVGARRDGEKRSEIFSCVGRTQASIGTRGYGGVQTDNSIRKDRKQ